MNENEHTQPVLDTLIQSRPLQMLKSIVPYLYEPQQKTLSFLIKIIELQRTMQLFEAEPSMQAQELRICSNDSQTERTCRMLNALREYCTPQEQENIDLFVNFFDMYASYETLFDQPTGRKDFEYGAG